MAQRSHIPKFGSWDGDNVPYTAYFENTRKEKVGGGRMNPNDPEENPDAFLYSGFTTASDCSNNSAAPLRKGRDHKQKSSTSEFSSDNRANLHQRKRSENKKSISENSNGFSGRSPSTSPSPVRNRLRGGTNGSDDTSYKSISVPKFGAWDERDPRSAEGFTVIFNKVKEEKQIAASKFPSVQSQTPNVNLPEGNRKKGSGSKMRCCLF